MEENINIGQPPIQDAPTPPTIQSTETTKKKSPLKLILLIFIFLLLATGVYYLIFKMNILETLTGENLDNNLQNQQEEDQNVNQEETLTPFTGKYLSTEVPAGWSVSEYYDGEGTSMLPDGDNYTGLTGLKIFKNEQEIFFMQAISGIGFAGCPYYAKFSDENPDYYSQILEDNDMIGEKVTVTDYTNSEYEEFTLLGKQFRRIGNEYIYDQISGDEYFESPCVPSLISFDGTTLYSSGDGYESSTFDYGVKDIATTDDLLVVDQILNDMKLIKSE